MKYKFVHKFNEQISCLYLFKMVYLISIVFIILKEVYYYQLYDETTKYLGRLLFKENTFSMKVFFSFL